MCYNRYSKNKLRRDAKMATVEYIQKRIEGKKAELEKEAKERAEYERLAKKYNDKN